MSQPFASGCEVEYPLPYQLTKMKQPSAISSLQTWMKALKRENNTCDPADAGHLYMEVGGERGMWEIKKKKKNK